MKINSLFLPLFITMVLVTCTEKKSVSEDDKVPEIIPVEYSIKNLEGNYVTEEYSRRDEGYDWIVASVRSTSDTEAYITLRSRSDRKKPTCTFEGKGTLQTGSTIKVGIEGKMVLFTFGDDTLSISTEKEEDLAFLQYFCSGGGSLHGKYVKIDELLDESQLNPSGYNLTLSLQGITFNIHASDQGSINLLTIQPSGLEIDNRLVIHEIDGAVTNAEIEDLNSDGSPEVLVYITSSGSGSYGSVIGYSVNNKKSMSQIYLPPITDDPEISEGYMGHDEFTIVETTFARRFPIYKKGDSNNNPTGGMRQVQYKLFNGEASRIFKVDRVIEW